MEGKDCAETTKTLAMPTAWLNLLQTLEIATFCHHIN